MALRKGPLITAGTSAGSLGIDLYAQAYLYDGVGNVTSLAEGDRVSPYAYPEAGASISRPNAIRLFGAEPTASVS